MAGVMDNNPYTIRNYQPGDFDKFVSLHIETQRLEPGRRRIPSHVIAERLGRPNYSPEQDLFLAEKGGDLAGYIDIRPELAVGRVIINCRVHPEHRRRGLATRLFAYAIERAKSLGARVAHVYIAEDNTAAREMVSQLGFKCVRRYLELRLDMAGVRQTDMDRAASAGRFLRRGEEEKLTLIQNRAFADQWGFNPNTLEEIVYRTNLKNCSPEDVVVTEEKNEIIGYCWTGIVDDEVAGESRGRIFMLGVEPDYRGRGVGKRVLLAGLAHLKSKGVRVAGLTVDSENKVALALYRAVGFEVERSGLWYEKTF